MVIQTYWNLYKESAQGKACINLFKRAQDEDG